MQSGEGGVIVAEDTDTFREYERRRAEGSVVWNADPGVWMVLGFDEADYVLRNEDTFAHPDRSRMLSEAARRETAETVGGEHALVLLRDEQHTRMHAEIMHRLSRNLERFRSEHVRPIAERYLAPLLEQGGGDFANEFAARVPPLVVASVLGLPWEDGEMVRSWKHLDDAVAATRNNRFGRSQEQFDAARAAAAVLNDALLPIVRARAVSPQDDLLSELWKTVPEIIPGCTENDIIAQCRQVFSGGTKSTGILLQNAGLLLFTRSDLWTRLKDEPKLITRLIEEVLRALGAVQQRPRLAMRDVELGGQSIKAGDRLYVILPAAGRDPDRYTTPRRVDLDQKPKRHLAFGSGPYICPGSAFARAEAAEVIDLLLRHIDRPRLDPSKEPPSWLVLPSQHGRWAPLHVRFDVLDGAGAPV
jgi:beta-dihydromenaquinone-9 omega-hydroxylase